MCDFLAETNAAGAENAAFVIKRHPRTDLHIFRFLNFVLEKARFRIAVINAELLQTTFARLIANRAIERMIDEEKFHHAALTLFHQRRISADGHAVGHILRAGNLWTRYPVDDRFAIGAEFRFAIRAEPWESHFDQTHPAIPRRRELLVVTIARHITPGLLARLDHARPLRKLTPLAVDLNVQQLRGWSLISHLPFHDSARAPSHNRKISITIRSMSTRFHLD